MKSTTIYEISIPLLDREDNPTIWCGHDIGVKLSLTSDGEYDLYTEKVIVHSTASGQLLEDTTDSPLDLSELVKSELLDIAESCKDQAEILMKHYKHITALVKSVNITKPKASNRASNTASNTSSRSTHGNPEEENRRRSNKTSLVESTKRRPVYSRDEDDSLDDFDDLD